MAEVICRAAMALQLGEYDVVMALLKPLLKNKLPKELTQHERGEIYSLLARCAFFCFEPLKAARFAQKGLDLISMPDAIRAACLHTLAMTKMESDPRAALNHLEEALPMTDPPLPMIYLDSARAKRFLKLDEEAKVLFQKAEHGFAVLGDYEGHAAALVNHGIIFCDTRDLAAAYKLFMTAHEVFHSGIGRHDETLCRRIDQLIGKTLFFCKQYEMAMPYLEAARDPLFIAECKRLAILPHREHIESGDGWRLCSRLGCNRMERWMRNCTACCKVWYCNEEECQHPDWQRHKPDCHVCYACETPLSRDANILRCSRCKAIKYCGVDCQRAHWAQHKPDCDATKIN